MPFIITLFAISNSRILISSKEYFFTLLDSSSLNANLGYFIYTISSFE